MDVETMREVISDAYPGYKWQAKCRKMEDRQVVAVYYSIIGRNKANKKVREKSKKGKAGYQYTIFDVLKEETHENRKN